MVHATGYSRTDLTAALALLHALHEVASPELSHEASDVLWGRFGVVKYKFSEPRFLGVLNVMPFTPHSGGSLYSPLHAELVRTTPAYNQSLNTPLAQPPQPPPVPGGVFVDEVAFVDPFAVAAAQRQRTRRERCRRWAPDRRRAAPNLARRELAHQEHFLL